MKKTILTALIVISSIGLFAQPLPPDYPHGQTNNDQPAGSAPFDGGLSLLLIMGAAFGIKKVSIIKKNSVEII
ncbi:MAG: PID-CTERM protein-sorting domain-containing protein [Bacteroidales bacterium]